MTDTPALESPARTLSSAPNGDTRHLIIVVRADPIVCGHSTEARNLAESAIASGFESVHIISYPIAQLENSGLPLKPLASLPPYSPGIHVHRPGPIGDYKVLDGRLLHGMAGKICDLLHQQRGGHTLVMDLYLVPHGEVVLRAVDSFSNCGLSTNVTTIAEAVGSDITNVVNNAIESGDLGAAQLVLSNFLRHDVPVAVSEYTRQLIVENGGRVDQALGTNFAEALEARCGVSYPAINTQLYTSIAEQSQDIKSVLDNRGLAYDGYLMFLSRVVPAKGVDDLIDAYKRSNFYGQKKLVIAGVGPAWDAMIARAGGDKNILFFNDVSDAEKGYLMHATSAYVFPSKPRTEFTETFGIAVAEKMLAGGPGPVVTTQTGGIPEATGHHCLEHEPGNVDDLVAKLNELESMSPEARQNLVKSAQDYALQFDGKAILNKLLAKAQAATR